MNHQELLHKKVRFFLIGDNAGLRTFVKIFIDSSYLYDLPLWQENLLSPGDFK